MPDRRIESASETPEPGRRVHEEQAVALLDDRGDERLGEADVLGRDALGHAHDGGDELARGAGAQQHEAAVRLQRLEDLVHEEPEELVDRDVAQELDRQLVDDPQRLDQLARAARPGGAGRSPVACARSSSAEAFRIVLSRGSSPPRLDAHARRGLGLDLERHAADA